MPKSERESQDELLNTPVESMMSQIRSAMKTLPSKFPDPEMAGRVRADLEIELDVLSAYPKDWTLGQVQQDQERKAAIAKKTQP